MVKEVCPDESYWTKILRNIGLYHKAGCSEITYVDEYYNDTFIKSFAFWKLFLIFFFLFAIGFINLGTKYDETKSYINNKLKEFGFEFLYLFAAFFVSTIVMYLMRLGRKVEIKQLGLTSVIIFIFCVFKHFAFELSGLYRMKFGTEECNEQDKDKEHFESTTNKNKECNRCDNGVFTGLFWDGLGKYGLGLTGILLLFFVISFINPNSTYKVFNFKFTRVISGIGLLCIAASFTGGFFLHKFKMTGIKECKEKECKKECKDIDCETQCKDKELDIFSMIKNGCASVSIAFMTFSTLILPVIYLILLLLQTFTKAPLVITVNKPDTGTYYNCYYKNGLSRFFLIIIESILIYIIFCLAEAGIECLRKGRDFIDLMKDTHFWMNTIPTALGIIAIQILLEYTNWFESHLFSTDQLNANTCGAADIPAAPAAEAPAAAPPAAKLPGKHR
jgi:hypothetical protein